MALAARPTSRLRSKGLSVPLNPVISNSRRARPPIPLTTKGFVVRAATTAQRARAVSPAESRKSHRPRSTSIVHPFERSRAGRRPRSAPAQWPGPRARQRPALSNDPAPIGQQLFDSTARPSTIRLLLSATLPSCEPFEPLQPPGLSSSRSQKVAVGCRLPGGCKRQPQGPPVEVGGHIPVADIAGAVRGVTAFSLMPTSTDGARTSPSARVRLGLRWRPGSGRLRSWTRRTGHDGCWNVEAAAERGSR